MPSETAQNFVLKGHVVTMDGKFTAIKKGAVYVKGAVIDDVLDSDAPAPAGFDDAPVYDTKGTIYPGLIELHNHMSYNALRLWNVPKKYGNRDQWPDHPEYHQLVTGPMKALGKSGRMDLLAAIVRYVESKCLFGGVTTGQGIALAANNKIKGYYKGVVRNVEAAGKKGMPAAGTRIADVAAKGWDKFFKQVNGKKVVILHLSEGKDEKAHEHFEALQNGQKWAITDRLIGIHCAALSKKDFGVMAKKGGSMVWSPLSNYLLYGDTAEIENAAAEGVPIALGSDWSPSGSKNLLGELKVARLAADERKAKLKDRDLIAMVTSTPAKMLGWDSAVGSIEKGKRADLLIVSKKGADPYKTLLGAREDDIDLVIIDGVARYGTTAAMKAMGAEFEKAKIAGRQCGVQYHDAEANPDVDAVTLAEATETLTTFFKKLGKAQLKAPAKHAARARKPKVELALDDDVEGVQRPLVPIAGQPTGWSPKAKARESAVMVAAKEALPLIPLELDPLTVADDSDFIDTCGIETNLPDWLKKGLKKAY